MSLIYNATYEGRARELSKIHLSFHQFFQPYKSYIDGQFVINGNLIDHVKSCYFKLKQRQEII